VTLEWVTSRRSELIVRLTLPYPPSLNHLYATVNGRRVQSAAGRQYKHDVAIIARAQGAQRLDGEVRVELRFFRPRRSGDLDNLLKATLDSLTGICWRDDSQIVGIEAHRLEDKARPRVDVRVLPVPLWKPGEYDEAGVLTEGAAPKEQGAEG
jgi:crossover junction endodeoxyribonuclease RusA